MNLQDMFARWTRHRPLSINYGVAALPLLLSLLAGSASPAADAVSSPCSDAAVMEGCGAYYWPDGTRYVGGFHGGFFDGPGTVIFPDGAHLRLTFQSGAAASGNATYVDRDGKAITGPLHDVSRDLAHPHGPIDYPFWRAFFGDQADVVISAVVNQYGVVTAARLYGRAESESFAKAAVEGIKQWHYLPATIDGHPVPMPYLIEVQFAQAR